MKKLKVLFLLLTVFLFFNALAGFTKIYAATNEEDFLFNASNGTITGYKGVGGNVVIPSEIGGVKVTAIGIDAFRSNTTLIGVSIPGTVKTIGNYAFLGCTSLKSVNIEYGVTTMNLSVFLGCSELTSISVPDSVTSLGAYSFMDCTKLKSVYLSKNIKTIQIQTFLGCIALTDISIPEGVTNLDWDCFCSCTGLRFINIPSTVTNINRGAFNGCSSLERMYLNGTTAPAVNDPPETFYNCNPNVTIYVKSGSTGYDKAPWFGFQNFKLEVINTVYLTTVSIDPTLANGTITANPGTCIALSPISLGVTPNKGWKLKAGSLRYSVGGVDTPITDYSFIMPLANVVIKAEFEKISITSFEDLSSAVKTQNVYVGTELDSLTLPNTLCGKNSDGEFIYIDDVIWQPSPAYNPNTTGTYTFSAELPTGNGYVFSGTSPSIQVTVNPAPTYTAYITPASATFHAVAGYGVQAATKFVIYNSGTGTITGLKASLTNGTKLEIRISLTSATILAGGTAALEVRPKTGIPAGTYTDTLNITGDNGLSVMASLTFTVDALVNAETPVITSNLTDKTTYVGTEVTLDATATVVDGGTVTYAWYKNTIKSTTGATALGGTTGTYSPDVSAAGTTYYYCVVTNTNNSVNGAKAATIISEIAEVMVNPIPTYMAYITPDSASFHAVAGYGVQTATNFVINSTGTGTITGLIASLTDGTKFEISDSLTSETIPVGGNTAVKVRPKTGLPAGTYTDTLNITGNNGFSVTANLSFTVDALVNAETPVITSNLADKTTYVGTAVTLDATATVSDGGTITYAWYKNTVKSTTGATALGGTTGTYSPDVTSAGTAYYYCVVTNTNNSVNGAKTVTIISEIAEVKVEPVLAYSAYITPDSTSFHVVAGYGVQAATNFVINSTGTGIISGLIASLTDGTKFEISDSLTSDTIPVGGTAAVKVRPKTGLPAGTYTDTLNITGNNGFSVTASLSFTVDALVNAETPVITSNLMDKTTYVGTAVALDATATVVDGGTVTYAWYKNTIKSTTGATALGVATNTYSPDVSASGTAYYYCVATNTNNSVTGAKTATIISEIAEVKVILAPVTPYIIGPTEMILTEGYSFTSTEVFTISGTAPVTVIKISGDDKITWNDTTKKLDIAADLTAGSYPSTLKASNGISPDATLNFTLTVNPAAPVVNSATISPTSVYYDLTAPADVVTNITWHSASVVTDVAYGTTSLTTLDVYAVSGSALTIKSSYINALGVSKGDEVKFTISFDKGDSANLTVTIVDSFIPDVNAELKNLMVNGSLVIGFDPKTTTYNMELPYGTATAMVAATPDEEHASVVITQASSLPGSATVLVTAQDAITEKTYTINFTLEPGPIDKTLVSIAPLSPITGLVNGTAKNTAALGLPLSLTLTTDDGNVSASITWAVESNSYNIADTAEQTFTVGGTVILPSGVINPNGVSLDVTISVTVVAATAPLPSTAPAITTAVLTNGMVGSTYSQMLTATGDTPITWLIFGTLPNGLTLGGSTISGTPTTEGTFSFTVKAENSEGNVTKTLSIYISPAPSDNNGGGSNDNSSTTPTIVPDKKPDQPVIAVSQLTPTVNAKGKATITVPRQTVVDTINKATSEAEKQGRTANGIGVCLDVKNPDGTKSLSIVLTQSTLKLLTDSRVRQFEVSDSMISLQFNLEALKQIQAQSTKDVTIKLTPVTKISNEAKKLIRSRQVYNVTLSYVKDGNTVNITSLNNGSVILSIPYSPGLNEDIAYLFGVYVDDKGNATHIPNSTYDANRGEIIFGSNHFSIYGVGYTVPSTKFTDISTHWAEESIDYVVGRGLLTGTSENTFSPDTSMSRGMLATALCIMAGADLSDYTTRSFTDVKADSTYLPHIEWAYKQGIISSIGIQQFAPDKPVTREEISIILQNYAKVTGFTLPITREADTFTDSSSISSNYMDAVKAMQQAGIMSSKNNKYFDPKSSATRAEVAAMLYRYIKLTIDPATAQGWSRNDSGQLLYYKDGKALTGWQTIDAKVYYFDSKGVAYSKGWKKNDKDDWYYFLNDSAIVGWRDIDSTDSKKRYYFDENSIMVSNKWLEINKKWYYFYEDGTLAFSTTIDGYKVGENGAKE